jgi:hypothetical protein
MEFEFDREKSHVNKEKHGIDFVEAQDLWEDSDGSGFPARSDDEPRYALIAERNGKIWVAFYTLRESKIRIISVRRARKKEKDYYEG